MGIFKALFGSGSSSKKKNTPSVMKNISYSDYDPEDPWPPSQKTKAGKAFTDLYGGNSPDEDGYRKNNFTGERDDPFTQGWNTQAAESFYDDDDD